MSDINSPSISVVGRRCCGCGACVATCPVSCLEVELDSCGFVHPAYEGGCIGCGKCAMACPALSSKNEDETQSVSWAKAKDDSMRTRSSSGAIFGLLAKTILSEGGVVYGAAFADDCRVVRHVRVDRIASLDCVMRSKYVQSTVDVEIYEGVARDLRDGRRVLFSGTACQVAGMRNYLTLDGAPVNGLLLVEVVCHGASSPRLWTKWLEYVSESSGGKITEMNFRDKSTGWAHYSVRYESKDSPAKLVSHADDWYMRAFLQNASLRESCLDCPAKRCCGSDLTLGDFWGVQGIHPEVVDSLGVSAVICNTEKGVAALDAVRGFLETGPSSMKEVVPGNPALVHSVKPYARRDEFLADVANSMTVEDLMCKWPFEPSLKQKVRGKLSGLKHRLLG